MRLRDFVGVLLTLTTCVAAQGPPRPYQEPVPAAAHVVSATTVAFWGADLVADGTGRLRFLVLARGTPGWLHTRPGYAYQEQGGEFGHDRDQGELPSATRWFYAGDAGFGLMVTFNRATKALTLNDTVTLALHDPSRVPVTLTDINAVLVDGVDSPQGPHIVRTLWVDPSMPTPQQVTAVIGRSPELRAFLRCDLRFDDDPNYQRVVDYLCSM